jgi:hypothetical protein
MSKTGSANGSFWVTSFMTSYSQEACLMEELWIMRWMKIIQNKIGTEMSPFFIFSIPGL